MACTVSCGRSRTLESLFIVHPQAVRSYAGIRLDKQPGQTQLLSSQGRHALLSWGGEGVHHLQKTVRAYLEIWVNMTNERSIGLAWKQTIEGRAHECDIGICFCYFMRDLLGVDEFCFFQVSL